MHNNFLVAVDGLKKKLVHTVFYLRAIAEGRIHKLLGFSRITAYAPHYTGLSERQTKELLLLGKRLAELPGVAEAMDRGELSWSNAREISRIAKPADQQQWIDLARSVSQQELRGRLREAARLPPPGETAGRLDPDAPPPEFREGLRGLTPIGGGPGAERSRPAQTRPVVLSRPVRPAPCEPIGDEQHLRIRMTAEQYAMWESLLEEQRKRRPGVTQGEILLENLSAAGSAGQDNGRSPYLVVLLLCPDCGEARIPTSRGEAGVPDALLAAAHCDGAVEQPDGGRRQAIMPRLRRLALQRARYACEADGCRHTRFLEVHHRVPVAAGGRTELAYLVVLCGRCHRSLHEQEAALKSRREIIEDLAHHWPPGGKQRNQA